MASILAEILKLLFSRSAKPAATALTTRSPRRPPPQPAAVRPAAGDRVELAGNRSYSFEVVGESYYQDDLAALCGGRTDAGAAHRCEAELRPDPQNPYDANAVEVLVQGRRVAHLPKDRAAEFHRQVRALNVEGARLVCQARIEGGWDRGSRGRGHFGVKLNLAWPLRLKVE